MSSSSSSTTAAAGERQTYWCDECELTISSAATPHPLCCPYCGSEFLEQMDSPLSNNPNPNPNPTPTQTDIEAIPTVVITDALLSPDPMILCAVCMEQFVSDDQTKQLPCKHLYHPNCILPWLSKHNTCPVCRFELPGRADWIQRQRRVRAVEYGWMAARADGVETVQRFDDWFSGSLGS